MNYWTKRATILENQTYQIAKKKYKEIEEAFSKAEAKIKKEIDTWYQRLADNNEITLEDAKRLLDKNELKEFKWNVDEYIRYGQENALNQKWIKELENASAKFHIRKYEAELINIKAEYEKAFNEENNKVGSAIKESYEDRYDHTAYELQKSIGVGFDVSKKDSNQIEKLIKRPWASDGKDFSERIWNKKDQIINTLQRELVNSILVGGNKDEAIKMMTKYVKNDIKNAKYCASRLIMTECSYFASVGQKDCFKDLDVEKYEIVATLDNKTSHICQEMDGKVFEMKDYEPGITAPPFHVFCRSTTAPYFDDEASYGERAARDHEGNTYYVPSNMTYGEWKELVSSHMANKDNSNGDYNVITPKNYKEDNNEISIAETLSKNLGIEVELLKKKQKEGVKNPDAIANNIYYEFKTPESIKGIDTAIRSGIKQVADNGGKVVVDIKNCKGTTEEIKQLIQNRVNRTLKNKELEVLLIDSVKKEIISIDKYNKIRGSYSHQEGVKGTSYYSNSTINNNKSQLQNSSKNDKINARKEYVDFKTIKEAEEYAKKNLGISNIYYNNIDIEVANIINKELEEIIGVSDKVKERLGAIGNWKERNKILKDEITPKLNEYYMQKYAQLGFNIDTPYYKKQIDNAISRRISTISSNSFACFIYKNAKDATEEIVAIRNNYGGLFVNPKYGNNIDLFKAEAKRSEVEKYHPIGCGTIKSIIDHEIGHLLDDTFDIKHNNKVQQCFNEFIILNKQEQIDSLSGYASDKKNIEEFIAESYTEYVNNPNPRKYARIIGEIIEETINE